MANDDESVSRSGAPIIRHAEREREFELAHGSEDAELLEQHIEKHLGKIDRVFHELISDLVHVDIHHVPATKQRPFHWLVTTGMSDRPMSPPAEAPELRYAELLIALPEAWPISEEAFRDERHYWPIRLLKFLARLPHEYETWLWWAHTIPNGDPPAPLDDSVGFTGAILAPAVRAPQEFFTCKVSEEKEVSFFAVVPLYSEEMTLKLNAGADALFDKFDDAGITELLDVGRKNVVRRWWQF